MRKKSSDYYMYFLQTVFENPGPEKICYRLQTGKNGTKEGNFEPKERQNTHKKLLQHCKLVFILCSVFSCSLVGAIDFFFFLQLPSFIRSLSSVCLLTVALVEHFSVFHFIFALNCDRLHYSGFCDTFMAFKCKVIDK